MKLEFRIPISPNRSFYAQIRFFNYALRRLGPPYSQARLMVVVGDHCDIDGVRRENRWSDDYDIAWERVPDHIFQEFGMWGTADWRLNASAGNAEMIILSDADTVLLQGIAPLLTGFSDGEDQGRAIVRGHMAHFPPPSVGAALPASSGPDFWPELFSLLDISWPETLHAYSMDGGGRLPRVPAYFNLGFVAMNGRALATFGERIAHHQRRLKALTNSHMSCQIAVTTMAYEAEMDIAPLPAMYNAANDLDHLAMNGLGAEDIRVLHYLRDDEIDRSLILLPEKIDEFLARTLTNPANLALQALARNYRETLHVERAVP
jgi:hypothetical protein